MLHDQDSKLKQTTAGDTLQLIVLPDLIDLSDLAKALNIEPEEALQAAERGDFGPYSRIAGRIILRREALLEHLERSEERPGGKRPSVVPLTAREEDR